MNSDEFRKLIERGDVGGLRQALDADATLANTSISWVLNQRNESDPLHYVSDCVAQGWLANGAEGEIATTLLAYGAAIEGTAGRESPLIASTSLGAERVSKVLIEAGAKLDVTAVFGATALHWAAWMGASATVNLLVQHGARIELKCSEFCATQLFWAVHGYGPNGPKEKSDQVGAARLLIEAGASIDTVNKERVSAIEMSKLCERSDMHALLLKYSAKCS